ncbi:glycosyltransferase family 2 protein [Citricoccus muralis]|uniref:Glycosyltransferase family 2 protein n=1 Tax=Citricoccus muralis TaxID=169134 RepID=A0ABY8H7W7_9MICC|nr:glycosyltransferase family 2 protein [Citricoccus muralis]WFP16712.1 glycosyltransferase family 2 protein [Citricoccus muralis]
MSAVDTADLRSGTLAYRLSSIAQRRHELEQLRHDNRDLAAHVASPYFSRIVARGQGSPWPAADEREYLLRQQGAEAELRQKVRAWLTEAAQLPQVASPHWDRKSATRVGIIADQPLVSALEDSVTLVPITPENWELELGEIDVLLVTSAWMGVDGAWSGLAALTSPLRDLVVKSIMRGARERGVPIAFWSTEDPLGFTQFRRFAVHADHVFTTAAESVPAYEKILRSGTTVQVLSLGINPHHHHPLGCARHQNHDFLLVGPWDREEYPERRFAGERILDGLVNAGADLTILDVLLPDMVAGLEARYPDRYLPHLHSPLTAEDTAALQRLLPLGVALSADAESQTSFDRRALELQAAGTMIVANYNAGLNTQLPHLQMPDGPVDVAQIVESLSPETIREAQVAGIRAAFSANTAADRMGDFLEAIGLVPHLPVHRVLVSAISADDFAAFVAQQTYAGTIEHVPHGEEDQVRGSQDGDVFVRLPADSASGPNLITDIVCAYRYSDADAVVVRNLDFEGPLYEYLDEHPVEADVPHAVWVRSGQTLAEAQSSAERTLSIASDTVLAYRPVAIPQSEPELSILVPIYNNGPHLRNKCFESLRRSSVFPNAEVLLVDDGSTDPETIAIVDQLEAQYSNVRAYRFPPGGSGSASRPRNKGLELVRTPYVTNLDPDDEQSNDGYVRLLELVKQGDYDFSVGNAVVQHKRRVVIDHAKMLTPLVEEDGTVVDGALSRLNYAPVRIQTIVARTEWLRGLGITQVEGCQGQDTFFFQQLFHAARKIAITHEIVHTYFAAVQNSVVNTVGVGFYRKYVELERSRAAWFAEVGLLDHYKETRLEPFFRNWFLGKLPQVVEKDLAECQRIIRQLGSFYRAPDEWNDPRLREFFTAEL